MTDTTHPTTPDQGDERRAFDLYWLGRQRQRGFGAALTDAEMLSHPEDRADEFLAWQAARALPAAGVSIEEYRRVVSRCIELGEKIAALSVAQPVAQEAIGTFNCPICGNGTPHHHSDFEQVQAMSEEQIDAELRALGIDPDKAAKKVKAVIDHCKVELVANSAGCANCGSDYGHHNGTRCPTGNESHFAPITQASKVEPVACWVDRTELENMKSYPDCEPTVSLKPVDERDVPLYLRPTQQALSDEEIEGIGHRKAWRYKYSSDPHHSSTYTFNQMCLIEFARAILAAAGGSEK